MNILLWIIQVVLAAHTAMGAMWKFSNSEQMVQSLKAIPHAMWLGLGVLELLCVIGLVIPAMSKSLALLVPLSAVLIALEMLLFCAIHLRSGDPGHGRMIYWLVVAVVCGFVAYGRIFLKPL